jgi:hypothetical protein
LGWMRILNRVRAELAARAGVRLVAQMVPRAILGRNNIAWPASYQ